jgi:ubiquinone/menaquinone biosynthesis C-methylase UbiE
MSSSQTPEFSRRIAPTYDALRGREDYDAFVARLVSAGDLARRRVLDVGCGTGSLAGALAARYGCDVVGVDASPEMIGVARDKGVRGATFEVGRAEALAFGDASFERATMISVAHHLERARAFRELRRVLALGGRLIVWNADPDGFGELWFMRFFPMLAERERRRFPTVDQLVSELAVAGFERTTAERIAVDRRFDRETALHKLRGRHASSFDLLTEPEYGAGLARAECELGDEVRYTLRSLLVVGHAGA